MSAERKIDNATHDSNLAITSPKCFSEDYWDGPASGKGTRIENYVLDPTNSFTSAVGQVELQSEA